MGFDTLLGNDQTKENLGLALKKGRISHFYLISGPEGSGKHTLARLLAAAILCTGADRPCSGRWERNTSPHCSSCRAASSTTCQRASKPRAAESLPYSS